jgi:hypothetical protein
MNHLWILAARSKQHARFKLHSESCTATIYLQKHRGKERFEVRYYDLDGSLQRLSFPTDTTATKFADTVVKALSANRENFLTLRGSDAYNYRSALELLTPSIFGRLISEEK